MPRSPEYVKAKDYQKFKWKVPPIYEGGDKRVKEKKPKKPKDEKTKPEEQEKEQKEQEPKERETQPTKPPKTKRTAGEGDTGPIKTGGGPGEGPGKDVVPRGTQAVDEGGGKGGGGGPGQDIERAPIPEGSRPSQWGGRWEVVRPDAIEGRPAIGPAPPRTAPPVPQRPAMTSGPQFKEIGPAHPPVNSVEQRQANLADLVRQHHERLGRQDALSRGRTPTGDTGEIVSEGTGPHHVQKEQTIHTGEIVGFSGPSGTQGDIPVVPKIGGGPAAIEAPSHAKVTGPVPRVTTDDRTQPQRPVRSGDTGALPISEYTHDRTTELPIAMGGKIAVGPKPMLEGPKTVPDRGTGNLVAAQGERTRRASSRPPSIAPSRQMSSAAGPSRTRRVAGAAGRIARATPEIVAEARMGGTVGAVLGAGTPLEAASVPLGTTAGAAIGIRRAVRGTPVPKHIREAAARPDPSHPANFKIT